MRSDMAKVVTERPRRPSWLKYNFEGRRYRFKNDISEDASTWEGTGKGRKAAGEYKSFDDHIRPLERYVKSNVGRKWDDVFSEIAEHLPANSMAGHHIRNQHVKSMVNLNPQTQNNKYGYFIRSYDAPIKGSNTSTFAGWLFVEYSNGQFYIDNKGVLCQARKIRYRPPTREVTKKIVDDRIYEKLDGFWYEMQYETHTKQVMDSWSNYMMSRQTDDGRAQPPVIYKTDKYEVLVNKKQLNSKELKNLGLTNDLK